MMISHALCFISVFMIATRTVAVGPDEERGLHKRIYKGDIAPVDAFKWMVALNLRDKFVCSASLISDRLVLTAAHCIIDTGENYLGYAGHVNKSQSPLQLQFESVYVHPNYDQALIPSSDIAVLVTREPVLDGVAEPLCLSGASRPERHRHVLAMGWGSTSNTGPREFPDTLQYTSLGVISNFMCSLVVGEEFKENTLCTTAVTGGICSGDSGGPLVALHKRNGLAFQVGVASTVTAPEKGTDRCGRLALYAKVSHYLPFIAKVAAEHNSPLCLQS